MPNIGAVLREEISRLSRKESRSQVGPARKVVAQHRRDIAALKQRVAQLERTVKALARKAAGGASAPASETGDKRVRFVAKGLRSQRIRLGLSAAEFGALVGVSAQSIYNWEHEAAVPRAGQVARLVALRGLGKREAKVRLEQLGATAKKRAPKKRAPKKAE